MKLFFYTLCCLGLLFGSGMEAMAQEATRVTGTIISENGEGLPAVTIRVINVETKRSSSTSSDAEGRFSIEKMVIGKTYHFEFSSVGYEPYSKKDYVVKHEGGNFLLIRMKHATNSLDNIVVTALGVKREEKSLGYSAQVVNENAVKDAKSNNWANTLSGKVAGLTVQGAGAGPMGSSRITLRGESSLNLDNNQALVIIDGVPVSNRITGSGFKSRTSQDNAVDYGSDVNDINPDDIERVTVLKGPAATALYGSRAAGGALIITTKSGSRKDKRIGVTINSNVSAEQVNRWPDYQFDYGEGRTDAYYSYGNSPDGTNTSTNVAAGRAFGPKFAGQMYYQYNPAAPDGLPVKKTPWVSNKNYISDFFQTGITTSNSIALEGGGEDGSVRLSVSQLSNKWIIPNTGFQRINASLSIQQKISDRLKLSAKINYSNKESDNLPAAGYNNQTMMYFVILGTDPNIKASWFKPYWVPGREGIEQRKPFNPGPENPYLIMYEMLNKLHKNNVIGNINATYKISDNMDVMVRSGIDLAEEFRSQQRPFGLTNYPDGMYREQNVVNYETNTDVLLSYRKKVNADWNMSLSAGGNYMHQSYRFAGMYADRLSQPGIYKLSNSLDPPVSDPDRAEKAIGSLYAFGQLAYRERIFVDLTGRNDWSSTLPSQARSYFYPSISTSWILSQLLNLPNPISFAKLRLSWAQVGNDTKPYQTAKYYDLIYGTGLTKPDVLFNPDLKPEITSSYEAGLDARFFKGRLGADVTVYTNNSRNQILASPVDPVSGYSSALINAGLINSRGIEVSLSAKPIVHRNFQWQTTLNWALNRSYVRRLANGIPTQVIFDHGNATVEARVGGRMGDIYGLGFQRSPDGKVIYGTDGLPASLDPQTRKWGNAFADWKGGLMNEFTYKNVRLSILLDGQKGGSMYSQTNQKNNTLGKTRITLRGRDGGVVGDGVVSQGNGTFVPNTTHVKAASFYDNYYQQANAETNIFDCSFLKVREVRLSYDIPPNILRKTKLSGASIALWGRDLFDFTSFPGFDPEGGNLDDGTLTPGVELTQFPSTRSIGINLTVKF